MFLCPASISMVPCQGQGLANFADMHVLWPGYFPSPVPGALDSSRLSYDGHTAVPGPTRTTSFNSTSSVAQHHHALQVRMPPSACAAELWPSCPARLLTVLCCAVLCCAVLC